MSRKPPMTFDLVRLRYVLTHRLEEYGLSYRQVAKLTGVSISQISHAANGVPISAGATFMLAQVFEIDLVKMLPSEQQQTLQRIKKIKQKQTVSVDVSRGTSEAQPSRHSAAPNCLPGSRSRERETLE